MIEISILLFSRGIIPAGSHIIPGHLIDRVFRLFNMCFVKGYITYGFHHTYLPGYIATTAKDFFHHKGIISSQTGYDFILQWKKKSRVAAGTRPGPWGLHYSNQDYIKYESPMSLQACTTALGG